MKIYIGPYTNSKKKKGEWIEPKPRKIRVRIDKWDTWSADHTLSLIIHPMLVQLKATIHGAPNTDDEDVPDYLKSTTAQDKEHKFDVDNNHFKRWDWILNEMIWSFEQEITENAEDQFYSGESDLLWQPLDKNRDTIGTPIKFHAESPKDKDIVSYQIVHGSNHTFKIDHEGLNAWDKRKKNGFRLFGKYFQALWD